MGPTRTSTSPPRTRRRPHTLHRTRRCRRRHRHYPHQRHYRGDLRGSHHRHHRQSPGSSMAGRRWGRRWDPRTRKVHKCALHNSTMRSRGFARSLWLCHLM